MAKLTDGYIGYQAMRKRLHLATYDGHVKYGTVANLWVRNSLFKSTHIYQYYKQVLSSEWRQIVWFSIQ